MARRLDALTYHSEKRPGKIEVVPSKPCSTALDLGLAYTPGVAEPCMAIHEDPSKVNLYTAKSNLVGVISNGTAVLGLGDIGPLAAKPVMEGKGILFKSNSQTLMFSTLKLTRRTLMPLLIRLPESPQLLAAST